MLTTAIGDLLPAAVAVALSPIPIIGVILMLGTPRARTNGPAFALGWVGGLTAVSAVVLLVAGGADDPDSATSTGVDWGNSSSACCSWSWRPGSGGSGQPRERRPRCRGG